MSDQLEKPTEHQCDQEVICSKCLIAVDQQLEKSQEKPKCEHNLPMEGEIVCRECSMSPIDACPKGGTCMAMPTGWREDIEEWKSLGKTHKFKTTPESILDFIRKTREEAKEEARREVYQECWDMLNTDSTLEEVQDCIAKKI